MSARPKGAAAGPKAGAPKAADDPAKAREAAYKAKQEAELDEMKKFVLLPSMPFRDVAGARSQLFGGRKPAPETKASNGDADVRVLDRKEVGADRKPCVCSVVASCDPSAAVCSGRGRRHGGRRAELRPRRAGHHHAGHFAGRCRRCEQPNVAERGDSTVRCCRLHRV